MNPNPNEYIEVRRARVNNLKDVSVKIPRDRLVVVTGLSGSGKSSLAFDTLYAEGQRRYVESLSVYARQFVGKMAKPECDYISGIPPAIAIRQSAGGGRSPRSTVGTSTEVYDYMKMLFARIGKTISPVSGEVVRRHTVADVRDFVSILDKGTKYMVLAPIIVPADRSLVAHLRLLMQIGYSRIAVRDEVVRIGDLEDEQIEAFDEKDLWIVVDRLSANNEDESLSQRLGDAVETAFFEGQGKATILYDAGEKGWVRRSFSDIFEADGIRFEEPTDNFFSFNSPVGACPVCEGFSKVMGIDEDLVIPNKKLSVYDNAVVCWRGEKMSVWLTEFIASSQKYDFPIHRPYNELTEEQKYLLWHGASDVYGIDSFFEYLETQTYKMHFRIMLARFKGRTTCPECKGRRLKKEALYVKIAGKNIADLVEMPISELNVWIKGLSLDEQDLKVGERLLEELRLRVALLDEIGLGYLTLDRLSNTLSGGESQRIALSTSLGSGLIGSLYILDEPSIGLHSRDTHLLIDIVRRLADMGNTVVVVEHDEEMIRAADMIIDIGPGAGYEGGRIVYQGSPTDLPETSQSHTVEYLSGRANIPWPAHRRTWDRSIQVKGAYLHNLKNVDVTIPLGVIAVVTGVSGSGKSSFVRDIFYEGMKRLLDNAPIDSIACDSITGNLADVKALEYVDQNSLGKSSRSNPVTYIGAYDEIRKLFAAQQLSKQMGYTPVFFSFNKEGGRCEYCKGEGVVTVEMQFMADIQIGCEECHGKRFSEDVLEVKFEDKNINDILEMTVSEAIAFFTLHRDSHAECKRIATLLQALEDVGLGYVKLGQNSSSLSGGESQRVKLAYYIAGVKREKTLFIFDEPTTGLHVHDVHVLMEAFNALLRKGHSLLIVEHNMEVIKCADYVIDLGPEGGKDGGHLVYSGTPEGMMNVPESYTGKYLKEKFDSDHR
ncbi:excinuclease ABC subunit UvrA [Porphyromonas sp.]|uniref:excinuclease ABC subunit UvrA n=1 Tax=Porphyromonas sp. TaxID=1924944 RepID=UPI0026DB070E|nr:excinuclease ABC subunit UvrA [Porphyromonas sp.]MDO4771651.1 excinuclease ABC subunit UvrA [Porphyromonas sp.]